MPAIDAVPNPLERSAVLVLPGVELDSVVLAEREWLDVLARSKRDRSVDCQATTTGKSTARNEEVMMVLVSSIVSTAVVGVVTKELQPP